MKNQFFILDKSKKIVHYTIPNINHLTSKSEGIVINWFPENYFLRTAVIDKITSNEIDFLAPDFDLNDYTLEDLANFIQNLKE